jgi:ketosteroid isomerase-like protein
MKTYTTPEQAEAAFYRAFEATDLDAMMEVWDEDRDIVCVHPKGPLLCGRRAIAESWERIFTGATGMRFAVTTAQSTTGVKLAVRCVHENIRYGPDFSQHAVVIATNVYRLTAHGWRLVVHHATPAIALSRDASELH